MLRVAELQDRPELADTEFQEHLQLMTKTQSKYFVPTDSSQEIPEWLKERNTVDVVQEEDSSSQSVNITVTGIFTKGAYIEVSLSDGASFFISDSDFLSGIFFKGAVLPPETVAALEKGHNYICCYRKAVDLISVSEHSAFLLRNKLLQRGFDRETVNKVINTLTEKNYLDDRRYAEMWLRSRLRKNPAGRSVLSAALRARGISGDIADEVTAGVLDDEQLLAGARTAYLKAASKKNATKEKIVANLLKKGYSMSVIRKVLEEND